MLRNKIRIVFEDGKIEEHEESCLIPGYYGWDRISEGLLIRMEVIIEEKSVAILLSGYNAYNLLARKDVNSLSPIGLWMFGRAGDMVDIIYLSLKEETLYRDKLPIGRELEGMSSLGWREGKILDGSVAGTHVIPLRRTV